jgi:hypothetical protein
MKVNDMISDGFDSPFGTGFAEDQLEKYEQAQMKMVALETAAKCNPEGCSVQHLLGDAHAIMEWLKEV